MGLEFRFTKDRRIWNDDDNNDTSDNHSDGKSKEDEKRCKLTTLYW